MLAGLGKRPTRGKERREREATGSGSVERPLSKKILLVDDDRLVLESLAAALEAGGYRVWVTDSTEAAVRLTAELEPDAVVTDYRMPGMDGVSLLERIRELAEVPRMVVYSATPPPRDRIRGQAEGVPWVAKSAGHGGLLEKLEEMLRGDIEAT